MKHVHFSAAILLALTIGLAIGDAAFAETVTTTATTVAHAPTQVVLADGSTVNAVLDHTTDLIVLGVMAVLAQFLGPVAGVLKMMHVDQSAKAMIKGKLSEWLLSGKIVPGQPITVDVHNVLVADIANALMRVLPGFITKWAGGYDGLAMIIRNRLPDFLKGLLPPPPPHVVAAPIAAAA